LPESRNDKAHKREIKQAKFNTPVPNWGGENEAPTGSIGIAEKSIHKKIVPNIFGLRYISTRASI
jgi:hypothetical protein